MTKENKNKIAEDFKRYREELKSFLPISFCVVNINNRILESNNLFEKLTGYSKVDSVGMKVEDLFLEKEEIEDFFYDIKKKEKLAKKNLTLVTTKGKPVPVSISGLARKKESGIAGYFLIMEDISEEIVKKKEMKEELQKKKKELEKKTKQMGDSRSALLNILEDVDKSYKEAEKERTKTAAIIENFIDGMLFFDEDRYLSIINPKAKDFFDIETEKVTGQKLEDLLTCSALKPLIDFIKDEKNQIKDIFREELRMGEEFYLEVTTTQIKKDEEDLGTLVHVHDISREKRIERIKSEFVSVAAHQLRTPLSGIKWTLETFLEEASEEKGKLDEDEVSLIKKAYNANERMVGLVNDLLNVSRIEEGRYVYEPEVIDVYEAIKPVIEEYKENFKEREDLNFKVNKVKKDLPDVRVDVEKIGIVIQNFLDNAIKYTDEGDVVLSIDTDDENMIRISVQDDGVGIPEEQQKRLFDKFFRAENVVRKDVEGSGLGLFISKNIIEAHGGEIDFNSTEGEGSIFYFTIPTIENEASETIDDF